MTLSRSRVYGDGGADADDSISIGCGSSASSVMVPNESKNLPKNTNKNKDHPIESLSFRRRLQMVGSPSDCNNSTNFFCWMSCLDIPDVDRAESYITSGYSLYCLDPSVLSLSGHDVSQAVSECPYGVHNAKCLGSWQISVPNVPFTKVVYNATNNPEIKDEPFCYGGTSMYMDGFHWMDTVCVIYLFPEWVLNTKVKFAAAAIGSLFVGAFLELVILRRRTILSSMGPGYRRLAASAVFYGLQLTVGYFAMLVVMTYSGPLFMCIILGIVCGHVLFNAKDAVFASKKAAFQVVAADVDVDADAGVDVDDDGIGLQSKKNNNYKSCCSVQPETEQPPTSYGSLCPRDDDENDSVPEGITPCCQHTL